MQIIVACLVFHSKYVKTIWYLPSQFYRERLQESTNSETDREREAQKNKLEAKKANGQWKERLKCTQGTKLITLYKTRSDPATSS